MDMEFARIRDQRLEGSNMLFVETDGGPLQIKLKKKAGVVVNKN